MQVRTLFPAMLVGLTVLICVRCGGDGGDDEQDTSTGADVVEDTSLDTGPDEAHDTTGEDVPDDTETGCTSDADCDDGDPCTDDLCDTDLGECDHSPADGDGDGYPATEVDGETCGGTDCDDTDENVHPDAPLDCDGSGDFDCDGEPDTDEDGDGYVTAECTGGDDCDDSSADAFPGSTSLDCGGADHDCNGHGDDDNDDDGYDAVACGGEDCDDLDSTVNPSRSEAACDGKDTNCDGSMHGDEDGDGDGFANETCAVEGAQVDCDDTDGSIHPGATEACDDVDSDCDGDWTEAGADDDLDGVLDEECGGTDCNDADDTIFPGADEVCADWVDQDCDGSADGLTSMISSPVEVGWATGGMDAVQPSVSWTGSEYGVVWRYNYGGTNQELLFARLDSTGTMAGSAQQISGTQHNMAPELEWSGSEYGLVWIDGIFDVNVRFARVSATGSALSTSTLADSASYTGLMDPDITWGGSQWGIVWSGNTGDHWQIHFARLDPGGDSAGSEIVMGDGTGHQNQPTIVWGNSSFGMCWSEELTTSTELVCTRYGGDGTMLTTEKKITSGVVDVTWPSLVWSGSEFAVAYTADYGSAIKSVWLARLESSLGTALTNQMMTDGASFAEETVDLVWTGSVYGITWDLSSSPTQTRFADAPPDGSALGSVVTLPSGSDLGWNPAITWSGSEFAVVWEGYSSGGQYIFFNRIGDCE